MTFSIFREKTSNRKQTCCCLWKRGGRDFWYLEKPCPDGPFPCRPVPTTFSTTFTVSSPPLVRICTTGSSLASPGTGTSRVCGCWVGWGCRACWDSEWRGNHTCYILHFNKTNTVSCSSSSTTNSPRKSTPSVRTMKKYIAHSTKNNNIFFVTIYVKLTSVGVMAAVATSPLSIINIQS